MFNRVLGKVSPTPHAWWATERMEYQGMYGVKVATAASAVVLLLAQIGPTPALADTIEAALVRAYQNNPQLNAQRAQVRSTDENVPQALSGYRPTVSLNATAGYQYTDTTTNSPGFDLRSGAP